MSQRRIVIDARPLEGGHRFRGIGRYAQDLLPVLVASNPDHELLLLASHRNGVVAQFAGQSPNVRVARLRRPTGGNRVGWLYDWLWLDGEVKRLAPALFYSLEMTGPRRVTAYPRLLTVHDLIPLQLPPAHAAPLDARARYRYQLGLARRADHLVTISRYSKRQIRERLGRASADVSVIYPGGPTPAQGRARPHETSRSPYLVYLGSYASHEPHKNLDFLLELLCEYRQEYDVPLRLVMIGKLGSESERLHKRAAQLQIFEAVEFPGFVSEAAKHRLIAGALALVFPSKLEGFGLPPLEAMALGVPVITAQAASLPEVVGEAALSLPLDEVEPWVAAIERVRTDASLRQQLITKGRKQATQFTWKRAAEQTWALIDQLIERRVASTRG